MNEHAHRNPVDHAYASSHVGAIPAGENEPCGRAQLGNLPDPCTSAELAAVLGKSPKTVVDWCQERAYTHIPCSRLVYD